MTDAGEDHGNFALIGGGNHFLVTHRTTRLDRCGRAGFGGRN